MPDKKQIQENPQGTVGFGKVYEEEKKYLGISEGQRPAGIAFSGGGIRSASFGLGLMQALVANDKLKDMHYMSTVSGGGYLGSALTWALYQGEGKSGVTKDKFPLGQVGSAGKNDGDQNKLLDYIRQHGNYLTPTESLDIASLAAVAVRGMLISIFVYQTMFIVALTIGIRFHLFDADFASWFSGGVQHYTGYNTGMGGKVLPFRGIFIPLGFYCFVLFVVLSFIYSLRTYFTKGNFFNEYRLFVKGQIWIGWLWKIGATLLLIGTLPYILGWIKALDVAVETATGSTLFGSLVGFWQYMKARKNEKSSGAGSGILIVLGALALIYGMMLFGYIAGERYFTQGVHSHKFADHGVFFSLLTLAGFGFGFFANLNFIGPHRLYRNRLMEAFMPGREAVDKNEWKMAMDADRSDMENMCGGEEPEGKTKDYPRKPYHIVNTNIILANDSNVKYRGRGGDNYIISRLYSGSDATQWKSTAAHHAQTSRSVTLATAVATSAAALNPNAAVSGEGVTRNTFVSILLSVLNLRLGYWTENFNTNIRAKLVPPNFIFPGITAEIFRQGFTRHDRRIQLSDGGHFENLAIYELIRRKAELIVLSDGGADPSFNFDDLANAVEKVRVDFGAKIIFRDKCGLDDILPGTGKTDKSSNEAFVKKYAISKRGFAIADIIYKPETDENGVSRTETGILVYVKLSMIDGLPADVYSYKGLHPEFPHQSTADQFFDEKQFEAYRELGYYIAWSMMESEHAFRHEKHALEHLKETPRTWEEKTQMWCEKERIFSIEKPKPVKQPPQ